MQSRREGIKFFSNRKVKIVIEIIATTVEDALEIEAGGADRIELISAASEGGLTPSYGLIKAVIEAVSIPVNVIIRPHSKHFVYTDEDIKLMKADIEITKALGANGVVLGVLTEDLRVAVDKLEDLLRVCSGLDVTFHRAIDKTNVVESVKLLTSFKEITSILTSGGSAAPVEQNTAVIKEMIAHANEINVIVGGGVRLEHLNDIATSGATQFHLGQAVRINDVVVNEKVRAVVDHFNRR